MFQECSQPPRLHQSFSGRPDSRFRPWSGCPRCRQQPRISRDVMGLKLRSWSHSMDASPGPLCPEDGRGQAPGRLDCQSQKRERRFQKQAVQSCWEPGFSLVIFTFEKALSPSRLCAFFPRMFVVLSPASWGEEDFFTHVERHASLPFHYRKAAEQGTSYKSHQEVIFFRDALSGPPDGHISWDSVPLKNDKDGLEASLHVLCRVKISGGLGVMLPCCLQAQSCCLD